MTLYGTNKIFATLMNQIDKSWKLELTGGQYMLEDMMISKGFNLLLKMNRFINIFEDVNEWKNTEKKDKFQDIITEKNVVTTENRDNIWVIRPHSGIKLHTVHERHVHKMNTKTRPTKCLNK